ncbi:MAG: YkgJ family cysteine cluster protein [Candidatus Brocadiales bacterium]
MLVFFPPSFLFAFCSPALTNAMKKQEAQYKPWYSDGLRFECQRCGNCCRGEPGYVWVTAEETQTVASYMNTPVSKFGKNYLRKVGKRTSLLERTNGDCIMYSNGCSIYEVRPRQCRTFPFWASNLRSKDTWKALKKFCPGVDRGRLCTQDEIERLLRG